MLIVVILSLLIIISYACYAGVFLENETIEAWLIVITASLVLSAVIFFFGSLRYYYVLEDRIVTKKLFTADVVVSTPYRNISTVTEYAGPIQALFGCGTVEIETNSGKILKWCSIKNPDAAAKAINNRINIPKPN